MHNKPNIIGTQGVIADNSMLYATYVNAAVTHADPNSELTIYQKEDKIDFVVAVSNERFKQHIIDNLLGVNKTLHVKIIFSKSLEKHKNIFFSIKI